MAATPFLSLALLLSSAVLPEAQGVATFLRLEGTLDPDLDAVLVARLETALEKAAAAELEARALPMDRGLQDYERDSIPESRRTGAERLARARQLAEDLETGEALTAAESALEPLTQALVSAKDARTLGECHLLLMSLALLNGDKKRAEDSARRAHLLAPDLAPDPNGASNDDLDLWKKVTGPMDKQPAGQVALDVEPTAARVLVDGAEAGYAPLTVPSLRPGPHVVRISKPGFVPTVLTVQVKSKATAKVKQKLAGSAMAQEVAAAIQADALDPKASGPWLARVATLGVDHALVLVASEQSVEGGGRKLLLAVHLVKLADGTRLRRVSDVVEEAGDLDAFVLQLVRSVLDVSRGPGVSGGASMVAEEKSRPETPPPAVEPPKVDTAVAPDEPKKARPILPILAGVGLVAGGGLGLVVVGALVVGGAVVAAQVINSGVLTSGSSGSSSSSSSSSSSARRERARRVTTLGY